MPDTGDQLKTYYLYQELKENFPMAFMYMYMYLYIICITFMY
jgi:hypothetical protein